MAYVIEWTRRSHSGVKTSGLEFDRDTGQTLVFKTAEHAEYFVAGMLEAGSELAYKVLPIAELGKGAARVAESIVRRGEAKP